MKSTKITSRIILTVDVEPDVTTGENYSGLTKVVPQVLDIVAKHRVPVTWFITHDYWDKIDQKFPLLVEEMSKNGEIGCHVHFGEKKRDGEVVKRADLDFQMEVVGKATYALRSRGFDVRSFRGGDNFFDENTLKVLERLDYEVDSSVIPGFHSKAFKGLDVNHKTRLSNRPYFPSYVNHCLPGGSKILEIPISIYPFFSFQRRGISIMIGRPMSMCRPASGLLDNICKIDEGRVKADDGNMAPIVLSTHPWEFLGNPNKQIQDFELFISGAQEALGAEFATLSQIRKEHTKRKTNRGHFSDRTVGSSDSSLVFTATNYPHFISHSHHLQKLLRSLMNHL